MDVITDNNALLERIEQLFCSIDLPGMGLEIFSVSYESGEVTLVFNPSPDAANQLGFVQGGVVATMLDACLGIAGAVKSGGVLAMPLAEMKSTFVRAAPMERLTGKGKTLKLGRKLAFLEASLFNANGDLLARASGTASPTLFPDIEITRS